VNYNVKNLREKALEGAFEKGFSIVNLCFISWMEYVKGCKIKAVAA
jgi:hypothetical protein